MKSINIVALLTVFLVMLVTPCKVISQESRGAVESSLPLDALIEVKPRLQVYIKARNQQISGLATKYGKVIELRLNKAADAGDLKTAEAFQAEKERIESLVTLLVAEEEDPFLAAQRSDTLPGFPTGAPAALVELRKIWPAEWQKIRTKIDGELQQSLKALEVKFTKARDIGSAGKISDYRESLIGDSIAITIVPTVATPKASLNTEVKAVQNRVEPLKTRVRLKKGEKYRLIPDPNDTWTGGGSKKGVMCNYKGYGMKNHWMRMYSRVGDADKGEEHPVDPDEIRTADNDGPVFLFVEDGSARRNEGSIKVVIQTK